MTALVSSPPRRPAGAARRAPWRFALLGVLATGGDALFDPVHRHVPLCPFFAITGWDCPLCGGLRAVDHLVHGQLVAALHANVLAVAAIPLVALWWADWWVRSRRGLDARGLGRAGGFAVAAVAVVFTVVRNLPAMAALRPA